MCTCKSFNLQAILNLFIFLFDNTVYGYKNTDF